MKGNERKEKKNEKEIIKVEEGKRERETIS